MNSKALIILILVVFFISCNRTVVKSNTNSFEEVKNMNYIESVENGFVPDKETAEKIADIILTKIYGDKIIVENKPYIIDLIDDIWNIKGTLRNSEFGLPSVGGVPYIKIRKSDGAILGVIKTK